MEGGGGVTLKGAMKFYIYKLIIKKRTEYGFDSKSIIPKKRLATDGSFLNTQMEVPYHRTMLIKNMQNLSTF